MNPMFVLFVLLAFVGVVSALFGIAQLLEVNRLRNDEEINVKRISELRAKLSSKRSELQEVRLNIWKAETDPGRQLMSNILPNNPQEICFFCAMPMKDGALACAHCGRPNMKKIEIVARHDQQIAVRLGNLPR